MNPPFPESDIDWMNRALALAEKGAGWTSPNPLVGAVVVKGGRLLAEGYHPRAGEPHAERIALDLAGEAAQGATLYVTLEPCFHQGRTPPCLGRVLESGVARAVVATSDPNPLVSGRSLQALREAGIQVDLGVGAGQARRLNLPFFSRILRGRPWVTLKYAMTLDGRIATRAGDSRWISNPVSRERVHGLRRNSRAVLVGYRTAVLDDPRLDCRLPLESPPRQPMRIVLGGNGPLPPESHLAKSAAETPTLHVTHQAVSTTGKIDNWILARDSTGQFVLNDLLVRLAGAEVDSLLVEGGAAVLAQFFNQGAADEVYAFVAPRILGDGAALSPFAGMDPKPAMDQAVSLSEVQVENLAGDALIHGYLTDPDSLFPGLSLDTESP